MQFLAKQLGLDAKAFNKLLLLILHSFFSGLFVAIFFSVANAEFVNNFGSKFLPVGYLLSGIVGYLTVQGYSRLLKKSGYNAFVGGLLFLLIGTILFRCILFFTDAQGTKWMSFVIFLFAMPFLSISGLEQSGLLLKTYGLRDTKKFAGIVNAGGTVAAIIGYLLVPVLIPFLHSRYDLFFIAMAGIIAALFLLFKIHKTIPVTIQTETDKAKSKDQAGLLVLLKQPYIRYIAICGGISMMAFYFVDYSFLINAKSQASSPAELTAIIGGFFSCIKAAELALSLLSGRIFRSFGLKTGIISLPLICLSLSFIAIVMYHIAGVTGFIVIIFALKFFERIISKAIEEPAYKNLYQLLPTEDRLAIQAKIDGGTKQLFIILGSIILILYSSFMPAGFLKIGLVYITIPLFLFWVFSSGKLVSSFKERLRDMLNSGNTNLTGDSYSMFNILRKAFAGARSGTQGKSIVNALTGYKLQIPFIKENINSVAVTPKPSDTYVPSPFFNHLIPTPGYSRFEIQLYKPLLIIPPPYMLRVQETKQYELLDEKELMAMAFSEEDFSETVLKDLGKKLDVTKSDHEKKLILDMIGRSKQPSAIAMLLSRLDFPDYYIRKEVYHSLEQRQFKCGVKEELYYRNATESVLYDLTFIISLLSSTPKTDTNDDLKDALLEEENLLKNRLLSVLSWKYDTASINVIRETVFAGDTINRETNNILALELIDSLVDSELKPRIMPVFEAGSYAWRLSALSKLNYFPNLTEQKALSEIVNYDYTRLGIWTKACALKQMIDEENPEYKNTIAGFSYHPNQFLRSLASEYKELKNGQITYPLYPKEIAGTKSTGIKESSFLKGSELYKSIKLLKKNPFFTKMLYNDLLKLMYNIELKQPRAGEEFSGAGNLKNKPYFITGGNLVIEFKGDLPPEIFTKHCITPAMFGEDKINKLFIYSSQTVYEIPAGKLADLVMTSDAVLELITE